MAQDSTHERPGQDDEGGGHWGNSQRRGRGARAKSGERSGGQPSAQGVRLQRVLADAGVASRRDCEALIEAGRVSVNGEMVRVLPVFVDPETDRIEVDGRVVGKPERRLYLLLNKPERVLTTVDDASEFAGTGAARMTVLDLVDHPARARLFPVGRLDFATRGLVLLTNDGELANQLTHPRYGVPKVYEAVVKGSVSNEQLDELKKLVGKQERQDARKKTPAEPGPKVRSRAEVELIDSGPGETTIRLVLRERTGYPLRKLIVSAGCPVKKLTRVALGPLELTGVREGQWRELTRAELMLLRRDPRRGPKPAQEQAEASHGRSGGFSRGRSGPSRGTSPTRGPARGRPSRDGQPRGGQMSSAREGPAREAPSSERRDPRAKFERRPSARAGSGRVESGPRGSGPRSSGPGGSGRAGPRDGESGRSGRGPGGPGRSNTGHTGSRGGRPSTRDGLNGHRGRGERAGGGERRSQGHRDGRSDRGGPSERGGRGGGRPDGRGGPDRRGGPGGRGGRGGRGGGGRSDA